MTGVNNVSGVPQDGGQGPQTTVEKQTYYNNSVFTFEDNLGGTVNEGDVKCNEQGISIHSPKLTKIHDEIKSFLKAHLGEKWTVNLMEKIQSLVAKANKQAMKEVTSKDVTKTTREEVAKDGSTEISEKEEWVTRDANGKVQDTTKTERSTALREDGSYSTSENTQYADGSSYQEYNSGDESGTRTTKTSRNEKGEVTSREETTYYPGGGGMPEEYTTTYTNADGSRVENKTTENADGTKTKSEVEYNSDGSIKNGTVTRGGQTFKITTDPETGKQTIEVVDEK